MLFATKFDAELDQTAGQLASRYLEEAEEIGDEDDGVTAAAVVVVVSASVVSSRWIVGAV